MEELANEWKEALLCAASAGDAEAARMYDLACSVADGTASIMDTWRFVSYIKWVEQRGKDNG